MKYFERIEQKLKSEFSPEFLEVVDDSASHAGHSGARPEGETHFHVKIRAAAFNDMNRVARQRAVMNCLKAELDEHVHALSLDVAGVQ